MPDHDGQRGGAHPLDVPAGEPAFQPHGQVAFGHIQQQSGHPRRAAAGTQDISGADVAAAGSAHVAPRGQLYQQISEGDAAQQIRDRKSQGGDHQSPVGTIRAFSTMRMTVRCRARVRWTVPAAIRSLLAPGYRSLQAEAP